MSKENSRRVAADLENQNALLSAAMESIEGGVAVFDVNNQLVYCNSIYRKHLHSIQNILIPGTFIEEITRGAIESGIFHLSDTDVDAAVREQLQAFYEHKEISVHRRDPEQVFAVKFSEVSGGGTLILRTDVTELYHAKQGAIAARQEADTANRAKSGFLANMSHELRTPLNAILGFSEGLMLETFGPLGHPKNLEFAASIHEAGNHLINIISDILDISRIEANVLEIDEEEVDPVKVAMEAAKMLRTNAKDSGITLTTELPEGMPRFRVDRLQLKQVLLNLINNAIKFTPAGGQVTVSLAKEDDNGLRFSVVDTGIGIKAEDIPKVMEPFGQVSEGHTREHSGTGLGMPICKSLMELHGGNLEHFRR